MKNSSRITLTVLFILLLSVCAQAGDEALYEKDPPADAGFFRILNITEDSTVDVLAAGIKVASVKPLSVSTYGFSETPTTDLTLNGVPFSAATPPGSIKTLIWDGSKTTPLAEDIFASHKKARLKLFNLSHEVISLATADNTSDVITNVEPYTSAYRDVNALTLPFLIKTKEKSLLTTEKIALKKGTAFSIFFVQMGATTLTITSEEKR